MNTTTRTRRFLARHSQTRALLLAALAVLPFSSRLASAEMRAKFVNQSLAANTQPGAAYDTAATTVFIDPTRTNWIAWNDGAGLAGFPQLPGEPILWANNGYGVTGSVVLTITSPTGAQLSLEMDQADANGVPSGHQQVIFGHPDATPDVLRADRTGALRRQNEGGAFSSLFTVAGNYHFNFTFRNRWACEAHHPDTWILVDGFGACAPAPTTVVCQPAPPTVVYQPAPTTVVCQPQPPACHPAPPSDPGADLIRTIFNVSEIVREDRRERHERRRHRRHQQSIINILGGHRDHDHHDH